MADVTQTVYVIGPTGGPYKVGYTISATAKSRLHALQTAHYEKLFILAEANVPNAFQAEGRVHLELHPYRLAGEWFNCDLDTVLTAMRTVGLAVVLYEAGERRDVEQIAVPPIDEDAIVMSPESFTRWLSLMSLAPYSATEDDCASMLEMDADTVVRMKSAGADLRTALACRALYHRLEPWE